VPALLGREDDELTPKKGGMRDREARRARIKARGHEDVVRGALEQEAQDRGIAPRAPRVTSKTACSHCGGARVVQVAGMTVPCSVCSSGEAA
jgi:hypothetical protein